jgi:hypothetical protein
VSVHRKQWNGLRSIGISGGAATVLAIAGCGVKPPDCTSKETTSLVQQIVKQEIQAVALSAATRGVPRDDRPYWEKVVARYGDALKIEVGEIVSNGYDSGSKKYSCEGKISFTTATSDSARVRSAFSSQATAKGDGTFLVSVDQAGAIAEAVLDDFVAFARAEMTRESQQARTPTSEGLTGADPAQPPGAASVAQEGAASPAAESESDQPKAQEQHEKKD